MKDVLKEHKGFSAYLCPLGLLPYDLEGDNRWNVKDVMDQVQERWETTEIKELEYELGMDAYDISGFYLHAMKNTPLLRDVLIDPSRFDPVEDPFMDYCRIHVIWDIVFHEDGYVYFVPFCSKEDKKTAEVAGLTWTNRDEYDAADHTRMGCPFLDEVLDTHPVRAGQWTLWPPIPVADALDINCRPRITTKELLGETLRELKTAIATVESGLNPEASLDHRQTEWPEKLTEWLDFHEYVKQKHATHG